MERNKIYLFILLVLGPPLLLFQLLLCGLSGWVLFKLVLPRVVPLITALPATPAITSDIVQAEATILAIVFSLSLFVVEQAASKFSRRVLDFYRSDTFTRSMFASLALNLMVAVVFGLFTDPDSTGSFAVLGSVTATTWFLINLVLLIFYYFHIVRLIDPQNIKEQVRAQALTALRRGDRTVAVNAITALGDVAAAIAERKMDHELVTEALNNLRDLFYEFYQIRQANPEGYLTLFYSDEMRQLHRDELDRFEQMVLIDRSPCVVLGAILDQLIRFHEIGLRLPNEEINLHAAYILSSLLQYATVNTVDRENIILVRQILNAIQGTAKTALTEDAPSRFSLAAYWYGSTVLDITLRKPFDIGYLGEALRALIRINRWIIELDALDVFSAQLSYLSTIRDQEDILQKIYAALNACIMPRSAPYRDLWRELRRKSRSLVDLLRPYPTEMALETFSSEVAAFTERISVVVSDESQRQQLHAIRELIEYQVADLIKLTRTLDVFFGIAAYALFVSTGMERPLSRLGYIREIWTYTTRPDADAVWGNRNLIIFDAHYLLWQQYSTLYLSRGFDFGGFHGTERYFRDYLIFCLSQCKELAPSLPAIPSVLPLAEAHYNVVYRIQTDLPRLRQRCDVLLEHPAAWDALFPSGATEPLMRVHEYVTAMEKVCEERLNELLGKLPLDEDRVSEWRRARVTGVEGVALRRIFPTERFDAEAHAGVEVRDFGFPLNLDRALFTSVGPQLMMIHEPGLDVVRAELDYLIEVLINHTETEVVHVKEIAVDVLEELCHRLLNKGNIPIAILMPRELDVHDDRLRYQDGHLHLVVDNLLILLEWVLYPGGRDETLILGEGLGVWAVETPFNVIGPEDVGNRNIRFTFCERLGFDVRDAKAVLVVRKEKALNT